mgnify:CR=1 FL=1
MSTPNQWGNNQPQNNPQNQWNAQQAWSAQPAGGQPGGQRPGGAKPAKSIGWPVWCYLGAFLLTLLTSFFNTIQAKLDYVIGSARFGVNWWGRFSAVGSAFGESESYGEYGGPGYVLVTLIILGLLAAATYFAFVRNDKLTGVLGLVAAGVQLLAIAVKLVQVFGESFLHTGAGWWLWLLISLATLFVSLQMFKTGRAGVEQKFNAARAAAQNKQQQNQQNSWGQQAPQQNSWGPQQGQPNTWAPQQQGQQPQNPQQGPQAPQQPQNPQQQNWTQWQNPGQDGPSNPPASN